ncbi:MAG: NAD(P)H-dependent oxidoreductase [Bacilli bacterium]|nr:NAD(P)H-dependent oxidoreductase [Bacilli bacterium]
MNKTLVIYYSFSGNCKKIAEYSKEKLNADLIELSPKESFSDDYDEVVAEWQNNDIKRDVDIKKLDIDISQYDKIVLITCVWWYGISPVMKRFLKEYDLSNKKIIVAASNAGWIGHALKDYESLLPNSIIKGELNLLFSSEKDKRHEMITSIDEIDKWLENIND